MNPSAPAPRFRQPWLWVVFVVLAVGAAVLAYRLFPQIFPVVSLDIRMDRTQAISAARSLATAQKWGPPEAGRDVASFGSDPAQNFIELEGGGKTALAALLQDDLYSPFTWRVRLFKESETNQTVVYFRPGGELYGYQETLRQKMPGASLAADQAREIAEAAAKAAPWRLPLERFKTVETSQVKRPGGRIDHTFVYERPDRQLGEGRLRLQLVVSGDRLTTLKHFVKVPEAFNRRYEEMRSANNGIAAGGSVTMILLYILGGCIGGFLFLMRGRSVLWRQPLIAAGLFAGLQIADGCNAWPLEWLKYDTALSAGEFVTQRLVSLLTGNLGMGLLFFLTFLAAEGLSRRAFLHHPQFWLLWSAGGGPSRAILGRTLAGYLLAAVMLLYVVVFYYFTIHQLGWWSPSEALVDPNSLAHYWPWLTPLANAGQAGFWEEMLFRALPLAGAALLGNRFGGRKWWIAAAFLLQAVVFAACHANYPGQPAYSRLVELLLPSFLFGALYLRFGLLPSIVMHFIYDVVLMALPIFAASAGGIWVDRTMVVLLSLLPLWIILWRRWQAGQWSELAADLRNGGWEPPVLPAVAEVTTTPFAVKAVVFPRLFQGVLIAGLAGLVVWIGSLSPAGLGSPLLIGRTEAMAVARTELTRREVKLPASFRADAMVGSRPESADKFVWQTAGREAYQAQLGQYLPQTRWVVRFATFEGDVAQRAEEWMITVTGAGAVKRIKHKLPEARAGATLSEADARLQAHSVLKEKWGLDHKVLQEVSATSAKRPARTDWTFVFRDPAVKALAPGEARQQVELAGAEVVDAFRFVFIPEDWERADRALQSSFKTGAIVKGVTIAGLIITGLGVALVAWSRRKLAGGTAAALFALLFGSMAASIGNRWPATVAGFSTAQPLGLQKVMSIVMPLVGGLFIAGSVALLAGLVARWLRPSPLPERRALLAGSGAGLAIVGGLALALLPPPPAGPAWPGAAAADTLVPWLAPALGAIVQFFSQTAVLLFVFAALDRATGGWQRQRAGAVVLAFLACVVLQLPGGGLNLGWWIATALAAAVVVVLVYVLFLRHDLTVLPFALSFGPALKVLADGLPGIYPGARLGAVLATLTFLGLGWWTTVTLRRIAAAHAAGAA